MSKSAEWNAIVDLASEIDTWLKEKNVKASIGVKALGLVIAAAIGEVANNADDAAVGVTCLCDSLKAYAREAANNRIPAEIH